ncbi:MAG: hypothetical protein QOE76_881, partial [Frankiales bacterium]|nr:hypothetical protein [Frankiales bacterium]
METIEADTPAQRLARYTPTTLSAGPWSLARDPATAAVLAACPVSAEDAKGLVSRLCQLLAGHPGWDRRQVPDLTVLVTEPAIVAHLARLTVAGKSAKTRENHRADLRRVARALAGTTRPPSAPNMTGTSTSTAPAGRVPATSQHLLDWLTAGVAPLVAVAAWEDRTGRKASRDVLDPVVKAVVAHCETNATDSAAGMVGLFVPVGTSVWGEVS